MTDRMTLEGAILASIRAYAALAPLIAELNAAQRHGNLDRIGNAAYDAQAAGDALTARLSTVFAGAADLSAHRTDAALT
jgi:hypothetical protein